MKISCKSLAYRYPGTAECVFEGLDIEFPACVTMLKGYSGCGKSTLLRLAARMLEPASGAVEMVGVHQGGRKRFYRQEMSFVFQNLNLLPLASVKRNLEISAKIAGASWDASEQWMEVLGLKELENRSVEKLSGGQRQRVAIARAIAKSPKVLFLDEPTSGLDDDNTEIIRSAVRKFMQGGRTICVTATHDKRLEVIADELVDFHTFVSLAQ